MPTGQSCRAKVGNIMQRVLGALHNVPIVVRNNFLMCVPEILKKLITLVITIIVDLFLLLTILDGDNI